MKPEGITDVSSFKSESFMRGGGIMEVKDVEAIEGEFWVP